VVGRRASHLDAPAAMSGHFVPVAVSVIRSVRQGSNSKRPERMASEAVVTEESLEVGSFTWTWSWMERPHPAMVRWRRLHGAARDKPRGAASWN